MIQFSYGQFAGSDAFPIHLQYGYHDKTLYVHTHGDFSELVVVLGGRSQHIVNGKGYEIAAGDIFFINDQTEHGFFQPDKLEICNLMFRPELVFHDAYDMTRLPGFQALFVLEPHYSQSHGFCAQLKLTPEEFDQVKQMLTALMGEYQDRKSGWQDMVFSGFRRLCVTLSRFYHTAYRKDQNKFLQLADAVAYLENHFTESVPLETLARISGYSQRQLMRVFQATFGVTPSAYVAGLRIRKAKQLLETGDLSIGEVAWASGFDDQNYFSRFFKKYTGMAPTAYRALFQN